MKILSITAGAANMYCGSCLRDNALAAELMRLGHEVLLTPVYTPTKTDQPNVSRGRILFGGISVYLQQHAGFFRRTPALLDRLWDSRWALGAASQRSIPVNPRLLGDMTVSMLRGEGGPLAKEFRKLRDWLEQEPAPDIVNLPNTLLIALAGPIKAVTGAPICCSIQGEELFLESLAEPWRSQARGLIRARLDDVSAFITTSDFAARADAGYFGIPASKIHVAPLGVRPEAFLSADGAADGVFRVGYLARIAPEKGLHLLAEAWRSFRKNYSAPARLDAAGYLAPEHHTYLDGVQHRLTQAGLSDDFTYHGELTFAQKARFLAGLDAFSVPCIYDEPKGIFAIEAMASGVPVVLPRRGALTEHVERTGGGVLFAADDAEALAATLLELTRNPDQAKSMGRAARSGVEQHYTVTKMAEQTLAVYRHLLEPALSIA
jgi:glycosyltransferase involved in cell wall biosynthesis